jgi:predicted RNase H-like HicB family nuclease
MKYSFILRKVADNYVAFVPDLPGCVASGKNADETRKAMKETVTMHLKGLVADNLPIPQPVVGKDYLSGIKEEAPSPTKSPKPVKPVKKSKPSKLHKLLHF